MVSDKCLKDKYLYEAYGLRIMSDFAIPELLDSDGSPDVSIKCGKAPSLLAGAVAKGGHWQIAGNQLLFEIPGLGRYYVAHGNSITVEPYAHAEPRDIRLYLLGTAFGALLFQRGILPLHGSAVAVKGRCVVFTGQSGAGKSTLSAVLRQQGYSLLTDDIAAVTFDQRGGSLASARIPAAKVMA